MRTGAPAANTVAVLPFENRAHDTTLTLLAEGLADQITTSLGAVQGIEPMPPASVRYVLARTPREPVRLGHALGAKWLVDGQLLPERGNVRVSVQLIEAASRRVRWTGAFQRPTEDLFAVISGVGDSVASAITGTLAPAQRASMQHRPTTSNEALLAYTTGLAALRHYDEASVRLAVSEFERATEADSLYSQAWAGLAEALMWLDSYVPPRQLYPRARAAAQRALALNPRSAAATATLAAIAEGYDWDPPRSESLARRALALDSTNGRAWLYLGDALLTNGDLPGSVAAYRVAVAADTLDEMVAAEAVHGLDMGGRTDEALALATRWRSRLPRSTNWDDNVAQTLFGAGRCASAPPTGPIGTIALACAGRLADARRTLDTLVAQVDRGAYYKPPNWLAAMYVAIGDKESALAWMARGVEARSYYLVFAAQDPMWNSLRSDPRFAELLRRIRTEKPQ